jgi:hypothetical protein
MSMIASTSQPGRVPNVPRFGNLVSSPSRSSERMASRTGWRLTPKRWARSTSRIRSPGASRPPRTSARSASAMSWRSERSHAGSTTIAGREPHGQSLRLVHPCIQWSLFVRPGGATAWHPRSGRPRFGSTISTPFRLASFTTQLAQHSKTAFWALPSVSRSAPVGPGQFGLGSGRGQLVLGQYRTKQEAMIFRLKYADVRAKSPDNDVRWEEEPIEYCGTR